MNLLDPEELGQLLPAGTHAYPGPIPTQSVSGDEFMLAPQTRAQRRVETRIQELAGELARRHGTTRRGFLRSAAYKYDKRAALLTDRIAAVKAAYEDAGPARSNVRYGYVMRSRG